MTTILVAIITLTAGIVAGQALTRKDKPVGGEQGPRGNTESYESGNTVAEGIVLNFGFSLSSHRFHSNGVGGVTLRCGSMIMGQKGDYEINAVPVAINGLPYGALSLEGGIYGCVGEALLKVVVPLGLGGQQALCTMLECLAEGVNAQVVVKGTLVETRSQKDPAKGLHGKQATLLKLEIEGDPVVVTPNHPDWVKPGLEGRRVAYALIQNCRTVRNAVKTVKITPKDSGDEVVVSKVQSELQETASDESIMDMMI